MIQTIDPARQKEVDRANKMIGGHTHRGESLRLYIDPRTWHDYIILEFGGYNADTHNVKMFGYDVEVYLVYGTDREHNHLVYNGDGC